MHHTCGLNFKPCILTFELLLLIREMLTCTLNESKLEIFYCN